MIISQEDTQIKLQILTNVYFHSRIKWLKISCMSFQKIDLFFQLCPRTPIRFVFHYADLFILHFGAYFTSLSLFVCVCVGVGVCGWVGVF